MQTAVRKERESYAALLENDHLREQLDRILEGHVGVAYSGDELREVRKVADERYKRLIPPGYKDANKKEDGAESPNRHGDYILWRQVLDKAKSEGKPILLMTDDVKDDWWLRKSGRTYGPRPELVEEIIQEAQVGFYMYTSDRFLAKAADYLNLQRQEKAIEEARELRRREEARELLAHKRSTSGVTVSQLLEAERRLLASGVPSPSTAELAGMFREFLRTMPLTMPPIDWKSLATNMFSASPPSYETLNLFRINVSPDRLMADTVPEKPQETSDEPEESGEQFEGDAN